MSARSVSGIERRNLKITSVLANFLKRKQKIFHCGVKKDGYRLVKKKGGSQEHKTSGITKMP
jgi:hypothetical protein